MRLRTIEQAALPRLAWCARIAHGEGTLVVHHGPWVEARENAFFEGAWNGPFESDGFDEATVFAGSGARLVEDGVMFAGPTHLFERLFTLRLPDCLLVSNSLPFVLVSADDAPDPGYTSYFFDLCRFLCDGLSVTHKELPTARARRVLLHDYANLLVRSDLSITRVEKQFPPAPMSYADHVGSLSGAIERVFANAAHPARKQRFEPLATMSHGYDASALAALGARLGCRNAFSFVNSEDAVCDDGAGVIAEHLGLRITTYEKHAFLNLPEPEPEFHACPAGSDIALASVEPELAGKIVVFGRASGAPWEIDASPLPALRKPGPYNLSGATMLEFRLRVGFFQFNPRWLGSKHGARLCEISRSEEMRPWSTQNEYDRPIPRRILEEAGVPRAAFGMLKRSGAVYTARRASDLTPAARQDFLAFSRSLPSPSVADRASFAAHWLAFYGKTYGQRAARRLARAVGRPFKAKDFDSSRVRSPHLLYTFHWGFERIRHRYAGYFGGG